jgi:hypothetical protein
MRRESDTRDGKRTGAGRRARDKILTGDAQALPPSVGGEARARAQNLMLLLADELRESALAAAGIEAFLVRVHQLLDEDAPRIDELAALAADGSIEERMQNLDDALGSLRRRIQSVIGASTLADNSA